MTEDTVVERVLQRRRPKSLMTTTSLCSLSNELVALRIGARGIEGLALRRPFHELQVQNDDFILTLDGLSINSSMLLAPTLSASNATNCNFTFIAPAAELSVDVMYELRPRASFVSKTLTLRHTGSPQGTVWPIRNLTSCMPFAGIKLSFTGHPMPTSSKVVRSHYGLEDYAGFVRWETPQAKYGALLTAQNPYLRIDITTTGANSTAATVAYSPHLAWRTNHALIADVRLRRSSSLQIP